MIAIFVLAHDNGYYHVLSGPVAAAAAAYLQYTHVRVQVCTYVRLKCAPYLTRIIEVFPFTIVVSPPRRPPTERDSLFGYNVINRP